MSRLIHLPVLLLAAMIVLTSVSDTFAANSQSSVHKYAEKLIQEGALLEPVNAFGDITQYVVDLDDQLLCGVSQLRLKVFPKENVQDVLSSYWTSSRYPRIFEYYEGYIYLPQPGRGLLVFDARQPDSLTLVKELANPRILSSNIKAKDDKLIYVDKQASDVLVLSLAEPSNPYELARHHVPECIRSFFVTEDRVYVLGCNLLTILDASDLNSLAVLGQTELASPHYRGAIAVDESYAYLHNRENDQIHIFDVNQPQAIERQASVKASLWGDSTLVKENFIFVFDEGLFIYDVIDPLNPQLVRRHYNCMPPTFLIGKLQNYAIDRKGKAEPQPGLPYFSRTSSAYVHDVSDIVIRDNLAYVIMRFRLHIFDISRPWAPERLSSISIDSPQQQTAILHGDYLYTARQVIDVSDPNKPVVAEGLSGGLDRAVHEGRLLVSRGKHINVLGLENPANPRLEKDLPLDNKATSITVHNGIVYLGLDNGSVRSCKLEEDLTLSILDEIELGESEKASVTDFCMEGDLLYVALGPDGIAAVDIRDPCNLELYSRCDIPRRAEQLKVVNGYAYVAAKYAGIMLVDMAEKGDGKQIASFEVPPPGRTTAVALTGNYVYASNSVTGLMVLVSSPLR